MAKITTEELDARIRDLAARCRLDSYTSFVEEFPILRELFPALTTGRSELLAGANPRALTQDECAIVFKMVGAIVETNFALREHAEHVALMTKNWSQAFTHLRAVGDKVERFANFQTVDVEQEDATEGVS